MQEFLVQEDGVSAFLTDLVELKRDGDEFSESEGSVRIPNEVIKSHSAKKLGRFIKSVGKYCVAARLESKVSNAFSQVDSVSRMPDKVLQGIASVGAGCREDLSQRELGQFLSKRTISRYRLVQDELMKRAEKHRYKTNGANSNREPKHGFVYIAHSVGKHKIGRSKQPENRIEHFDTQMPVEVQEIHRFEADDYHKAENLLHNFFEEDRTSGEWFDLSNSQLSAIKNIDYFESDSFYREDGTNITQEIEHI